MKKIPKFKNMLGLGIPKEHYLTLHTVFSGNNLINCKFMSNVTTPNVNTKSQPATLVHVLRKHQITAL